MSDSSLRPFSRKYWQERRILFAAEQQRKRRFWYVIGAGVVILFVGLLVVLSFRTLPEQDRNSIIMTGE